MPSDSASPISFVPHQYGVICAICISYGDHKFVIVRRFSGARDRVPDPNPPSVFCDN